MATSGVGTLTLTNHDTQPSQNAISINDQLPMEIIEKILNYLSYIDWKKSMPHRVCVSWKLLSEKSILNTLKIKQLVVGSNKWNAKWERIKILPESVLPEAIELNIDAFAKKPCPFNSDKLFIDTHLITYIGKEISVLSTEKDLKILPNSIATMQVIAPRNTIFCLYNAEDGNNLEIQAVGKAKWIALYKEPICIFRKDGQDIKPGDEEEKKLTIAEENHYRSPTVQEYGITFFAHKFNTGKPCSTWLSDSKDRLTLTEDILTHNGYEEKLIVFSDGCGVSTQGQFADINTSGYWDRKGTFGLMLCKDL